MNSKPYTTKELIDFEEKVAELFNQGQIRAPVHLSSGGEEELIKIFSGINKSDYVFSTWRSHYHALLKGVPQELLLDEILSGNSISLNFPEYNFYSSAIAGTHMPIATGLAYALKMQNMGSKVWCFVGDMTSESGIANSSIKYSSRHKLPITFVIEDNNLSVCSDTRKVWNSEKLFFADNKHENVLTYKYKNKYPHAGAGKRVQF